MRNGSTAFERLTQRQIDAAATTLYDYAWNGDPNDPWFFKKTFEDASKVAKDHHREWARAILLAGETGEAQHTWARDFPRMKYESGNSAAPPRKDRDDD